MPVYPPDHSQMYLEGFLFYFVLFFGGSSSIRRDTCGVVRVRRHPSSQINPDNEVTDVTVLSPSHPPDPLSTFLFMSTRREENTLVYVPPSFVTDRPSLIGSAQDHGYMQDHLTPHTLPSL